MTTRRRPHRGGVGGFEPRAVVDSRAQRAWALDAAGKTQREIALELGVTQAAVSKILRRTADRLAVDLRDDAGRQVVRALNRETYLYREALRAFERSQRDQTRRRQRQVTDARGHVVRGIVEADVTERDGDPRFLEQAGRALERTAALQGLTHGAPARSRVDEDPNAARDRVASQLDRLAAVAAPSAVAERPE
jgi:predicted transcriptional regulator